MKDAITGFIRKTPLAEVASSIYSRYKKDRNYYYDKDTFKIMTQRLKRTSNCIDIGAHRGLFLKHMLRIAPQGKHMAFEPLPDLYQYLSRKFPNVQVFDYALSDQNGQVNLHHVVNAPAFSGIKRRDYDGHNVEVKEIKVSTHKLDELYPAERKLDFVKIDVEGAEYLTLKGAVNTIRRNRPLIVFEFGAGAANYYRTKPEDIYRLFEECGMHISLLHDFLNEGKPLSMDYFNKQYFGEINYYFIAHE